MAIFESFENLKDSELDTKRSAPVFNTVEMSIKTFVDKLKDINSLSEDEVINIISRQYNTFLDYDLFLSNRETRAIAQEMFTNKKFLNCLIKCIDNRLIVLNDHQITCCNKLTHDYIAHHGENQDKEITDLLLSLSFKVNHNTILILSAIIPMNCAKVLALMYKSSFRENVNICRVNHYIIKCGINFKENDIVAIYSKLYPRVTGLFCETMLELPEADYNERDMVVYNEISKSMIAILDTMPSIDIIRVLTNYSVTWSMRGQPSTRISMKNIDENKYARIKAIISSTEFEEGIVIP